jgi:acetyl-CoA synthetase
VLVMLPRAPAWWIEMLGLIRLGAVPIPAMTLLTAKNIACRVQVRRSPRTAPEHGDYRMTRGEVVLVHSAPSPNFL